MVCIVLVSASIQSMRQTPMVLMHTSKVVTKNARTMTMAKPIEG
ncbi:hypothetical protein Gotur_004583 [Gossypium turneri]